MKNGLSKIEKTKLEEQVKAMTEEEIETVLGAIKSKYMFEELQRRDCEKDEMKSKILDAIMEVSN